MKPVIIYDPSEPMEALVEVTWATRTKELALDYLWATDVADVWGDRAQYEVTGKSYWSDRGSEWIQKDGRGAGGKTFPFWAVEVTEVEEGIPAPFLGPEQMVGWRAYA